MPDCLFSSANVEDSEQNSVSDQKNGSTCSSESSGQVGTFLNGVGEKEGRERKNTQAYLKLSRRK